MRQRRNNHNWLVTRFVAFRIMVNVPTLLVIPRMFFSPFLANVYRHFMLIYRHIVSNDFTNTNRSFFRFGRRTIRVSQCSTNNTWNVWLLQIIRPTQTRVPTEHDNETRITMGFDNESVQVTFNNNGVFRP